MTRRYSHRGPVVSPRGKPLSNETLATLRDANEMLSWSAIARYCGVGRSTMYRVMCGGDVHDSTGADIEAFAEKWRAADVDTRASMMRRWSEKRRAAHERKARAA